MALRIMLFVVMLARTECIDRKKLGSTPSPQKTFDVEKYMGDWYMQATLPPCSWAGSYDFKNFVVQYSKQHAGNVYLKASWWSTVCSSATLDLAPNNKPGVFTLKDPIGDMLSGLNAVVATDYKKVAVYWGCTKLAVGGVCGDPYVAVITRKRDPSPQTWKIAETVLDYYWNLGLSEMVKVVHDKDACVQFKDIPHQYLPPFDLKRAY